MPEFNQYTVYYYSAPQYSWEARVNLFLNNSSVGTITFMKAGKAIPANTQTGGISTIHFPSSHFANIMELLRNEKPLYITVVAANGIGTISTSAEPVGEGEPGA